MESADDEQILKWGRQPFELRDGKLIDFKDIFFFNGASKLIRGLFIVEMGSPLPLNHD